eukprot:CAMPEP_0115103378 /NCGR_PEP_ID=MMETSP0227-20121206/34559_1 /TAXON_ID=89957 /ORGANISM="Polarella glacialis, Strain CCMP 1383" /LENGTH=463 /DNA_ID=CAMNT_0002499843 /DNA_START=59 /DNA_END=1450 /DNA_ORIENTATION=+
MSSLRPSSSGSTSAFGASNKGGVMGMLDAANATSVAQLPELHQDFFRTRLWGPGPAAKKPTFSFKETVISQAAELVGPSSSAARPPAEMSPLMAPSSPPPRRSGAKAISKAPRPSGVNRQDKSSDTESQVSTPVRRSGRLRRLVDDTPPPPSPLKPARQQKEVAPKKRVADVRSSPPPMRRYRTKSPSPVPAPLVQAQSRSSGLASSPAVASLKRKGAKAQVIKDQGLLKRPRADQDRFLKLRSLILTQVPVKVVPATGNSGDAGTGRPQRCRMKPLESWRNERVVFERTPGSKAPSVVAVELNLSPRPGNEPRKLHCTALQSPLQQPGKPSHTEFVGLRSSAIASKVYSLPLKCLSGGEPYTVMLRGCGVIYVLEGSLRYAREGSADEIVLHAGDTALLRGGARPVLAAPACDGSSTSGAAADNAKNIVGARFRWIQVSSRAKKSAKPATPVENAPGPIGSA